MSDRTCPFCGSTIRWEPYGLGVLTADELKAFRFHVVQGESTIGRARTRYEAETLLRRFPNCRIEEVA